ncbi:MAG: serine protease, partial [Planctomycetota bacterium]|nr:serine protease [Planctomycetota bacterium]
MKTRFVPLTILTIVAGASLTTARPPQRPDVEPRVEVVMSDHAALHAAGEPRDGCALCDLYDSAQHWVVRIHTIDGEGTGVVLDGGVVITNAHVVGQSQRVGVERFDGDRLFASIIRRDDARDLAILALDDSDLVWGSARFSETNPARVGSDVYVIGHPLGLGWTISRGIISANRGPGEVAISPMIQTDAAISPGN